MKTHILSIAWSIALVASGCSDTSSGPENVGTEGADGSEIASGDVDGAPEEQDASAGVEDAAGVQNETDSMDSSPASDVQDESDSEQQEEPDTAEPAPEEQDTWVAPSEPEIPEPDVSFDFSLCSDPGGAINIYDVQNPDCPDHFNP